MNEMSNSNNEDNKSRSLINTGQMVSLAIGRLKASVREIKEINTILTEISKNSNLTSSELKKLEDDAFKYAKKYGTSVSSYLLSVQKMYQADCKNARQIAELSSLIQTADGISPDLADSYLIAADAAYGYSGNIEKLTRLMDGQNQVAGRNALSMEKLADATKTAGDMLTGITNISESEMTALLGTGISASGESGETVARAVKSILMDLQGISGMGGFDGEIIDEETLARAEARCHSVNVELKSLKDGVVSLREPMEILKDLANVYSSLPKNSIEKSGILSDIGNRNSLGVLDAILSNWDQVEKMLDDYENASGSVLEDAMKSASSLEGSLNRLENTWTDTVSNMTNPTLLSGAVNALHALLSIINQLTSALGTMGNAVAIGGGLFTFLQKDRSKQRFCPTWV